MALNYQSVGVGRGQPRADPNTTIGLSRQPLIIPLEDPQ